MRRTYTISPSAGGQLITEYVNTYPQLTVINTGQATVYLGDDSSVDSTNGVPLTPGMATAWSSSPALYAAADTASTILITDNASNPLTANLPKTTPTDAWTWQPGPVPQTADTGVSSDPQLNTTATAQCAYALPLYTTFSSRTCAIALVSTLTGSVTTLATVAIPTYTNQNLKGLVTGITIPYGGYTITITASGSTVTLSAAGTVTMIGAA